MTHYSLITHYYIVKKIVLSEFSTDPDTIELN